MTEAPLLNNEAARSATGEILDQSTTQALEARQQELATQRLTDPKTGEQGSSESTQTSDQTPPPGPTDTSTTTEDGKTLLTKADDKSAPTGTAPDKYEPFKLPEGYTLSAETVDKIAPVLKELNLDQAGAQKLVDFHVAQMIESAKAPAATYEQTRTAWQGEVLSDPEIKSYSKDGKSGIEAVKIDLGKAISVMGPELGGKFKAAMDLTGAGDNPAFVKGFWKLAQHVIEGKPVSGKSPSPLGQVDPNRSAKPSAAQSMYPGLPSAAG
jgi:hypothetical protein